MTISPSSGYSAGMMSWPASPRIRIRPIGPGSPMRRLGAPRSTLAGGASDRSGRWPSRVWTTSMPLSRAASSTAAIGFTARASCETSLPSVSPKPPGSMKSRCMSMMRSAVVDQSRSIGPAPRRPCRWLDTLSSPSPHAPEPENSRSALSKAYAIVYNGAMMRRLREIIYDFQLACNAVPESAAFAVRSFGSGHLLIRWALRCALIAQRI